MDSFFSGIRATLQDAFIGSRGVQTPEAPTPAKILEGWERQFKNITLGQYQEVRTLLTHLARGEVSAQDEAVAQTVFNTLIRDQEYAVFAAVFEAYNKVQGAKYPVNGQGVSTFKSTLVLRLPKDWAPTSEPVYGGTKGLDTARSPIWATFSRLGVDQLVVRAPAPGEVVSAAACTIVASLLSSDKTSELVVQGALEQPDYLAETIEESQLVSAELVGTRNASPAESVGYRRLLDGMSRCASFKHLTVGTTATENLSHQLYKFGLASCPANLVTLKVVGSPLASDRTTDEPSDFEKVVQIAAGIKTLSTFVVHASVNGLDALMSQVLKPLANHPSLVHLDIRGNHRSSSVGQEVFVLPQLLAFSIQCPSLRHLTWARIPGSAPRADQRAASWQPHSSVGVNTAWGLVSFALRSRDFKLTSLTLGGSLVSRDMVGKLVVGREQTSTLRFVDLSDCELDQPTPQKLKVAWTRWMPAHGLLLPGAASPTLSPQMNAGVTTTNDTTVTTSATTHATTITGTMGSISSGKPQSTAPKEDFFAGKLRDQAESAMGKPQHMRPKTADEILDNWTRNRMTFGLPPEYERVRQLLVNLSAGVVSAADEMEIQAIFNTLIRVGQFEVFADLFEVYSKVQRALHPRNTNGESTFKSTLTLQLPQTWKPKDRLSMDGGTAVRLAFGRIQVAKLVVLRPPRVEGESNSHYSMAGAPEAIGKLMWPVLKQGKTTELVIHGDIPRWELGYVWDAIEEPGLQSVELGDAAPIDGFEPTASEQKTYTDMMKSLASCSTLTKLTLAGADFDVSLLTYNSKFPTAFSGGSSRRSVELIAAVQENNIKKVQELRPEPGEALDLVPFATSFAMARTLWTPTGEAGSSIAMGLDDPSDDVMPALEGDDI